MFCEYYLKMWIIKYNFRIWEMIVGGLVVVGYFEYMENWKLIWDVWDYYKRERSELNLGW